MEDNVLNRDSVLNATNYGFDIYAHILRCYYPGETVLKLVGRDCVLARNPFNQGRKTLHVWIEKLNPSAKLSDELARHTDESGAIPAGDALDFAELHYHQSGQELLTTLNREMYLQLDVPHGLKVEHIDRGPKVSFYRHPITTTEPYKEITIRDIFNYIVGHYAVKQTLELREAPDKKKAGMIKKSRFDFATFGGTFSKRANDHVKKESGLMCLDFDHVPNVEKLFSQLLKDETFTTVLLFRSPSGDGLKWVIEIDRGETPFSQYFRAVENYIRETYNIAVDGSGKDIARACFLPYDQDAYINPNYK